MGDDDIYIIEVEGALQFLVLIIEAYSENIISKEELINFLVDFLYQ